MKDLRGASVQTPTLGGDFPGPSREIRQEEATLERQLSELRQREENLQRQLREKDQEVNELELSLSLAQQTISEQQQQESCDWVISRDEIQLTNRCLGRGG